MNLRLAGIAVLAAIAIGLTGVATWKQVASRSSRTFMPPASGESGSPEASAKTHRSEGQRDHSRLLDQLIAIGITGPGEESGNGESRFHQMVAGLKSVDFADLVERLSVMQEREPVTGGHDLQMRLLVTWAGISPAEAAAALSSLAAKDQPDACRIIATTWTRSQPEEALAWARQVPSDDLRAEALTGIGQEEAFKNPRKAIELAEEAGTAPGTANVIDQAVTAWAASDAVAAMNWGKQISDPELREKVLAGVAVSWADQDPYGAAKLVLDSVGEGQLEENSLVGIVQRIALHDIDSARDWVAQFPEGRMRERAETELVRITARAALIAPPTTAGK